MIENIVVDAGPFIHLNQINLIDILKKFPIIYTTESVLQEISPAQEIHSRIIRKWKNLKISTIKEKNIPQIEKAIREFDLHYGEKSIIYTAYELPGSIVLTDDLDARHACEKLKIEVHGSVGIIAYAFHRRWISLKKAEESLLLLYRRSNLFVTSAIIERAIREIRSHSS